jgi:hypothetical protein
LPASYTFTAADNGVHTFSATLRTAGSRSLTATDTATSSITGIQTITVQPAVASSLRVSGFPSPSTVGVAQSFTVTALDAYGNTATGYRGTIRVSSTDIQAVLPANYTFTAADNGAHTFSATLTSAGSQVLTATDTVTGSIAGAQTITVQAAPPVGNSTLVAAGSLWKYLDNGSNQGTAWRATAFNDTTWSSGSAQLGYGDGDEQTVVGYGPNASNKHVTTYFRKSIDVSDPSVASGGLTLNLRRDDGAVVYLNGTEVFRSNMPTGTIGYQTFSSKAISGTTESTWFTATINPALLVAGINTVAVEIHQSDRTSSDLTFDLSLIGSRTSAPTTMSNPGVAGIVATAKVQPAVATSLRVSAFPSPTQAGVAKSFVVTALDAYANTATGYQGTVKFSSTDSQAYFLVNYTFSATLKAAGIQSSIVTDVLSTPITAVGQQ